MLSADRIATENFVQTFVLEQCDAVIFVVGYLNENDQRRLRKVLALCKTTNYRHVKNIFIIHNFQRCTTPTQLNYLIEKEIK